jgi:hypothetical protein
MGRADGSAVALCETSGCQRKYAASEATQTESSTGLTIMSTHLSGYIMFASVGCGALIRQPTVLGFIDDTNIGQSYHNLD